MATGLVLHSILVNFERTFFKVAQATLKIGLI
jgi:hypothetical protein